MKRQTIECGTHEGERGKERNLKRAPEVEGSVSIVLSLKRKWVSSAIVCRLVSNS